VTRRDPFLIPALSLSEISFRPFRLAYNIQVVLFTCFFTRSSRYHIPSQFLSPYFDMPQRNLPPHHYPYSQVLSALRKNDLMRLSVEFGLSVEGSVVHLRNRLKDYLNLRRDTLYPDPRYKALYPKHRRPNAPHSPPASAATPSRSASPAPSERSQASEHSFDSWHGIEAPTDNRQGTRNAAFFQQAPQDYYAPLPPPSPSPFNHDAAGHPLRSLSPPIHQNHPPPVPHHTDGLLFPLYGFF
jgi:hypothetical protein